MGLCGNCHITTPRLPHELSLGDAGDRLDQRLQGRIRRFDQMGPHLLEQISSFLGRDVGTLLFGECQQTLKTNDHEIAEQVSANALGTTAPCFLLKATDRSAYSGFDLTLGFHGDSNSATVAKICSTFPGPPTQPRRSPLLIVGLIFLVIGSVFVVIGIGIGQSNRSFASGAHETEGTVIRMVASGNRGSSPVVRYEVDGKAFELQSSVSSSPPRDKVTILYHADEPHKGTIRSFMDQWLFPTIFTGIGSLFVLIGLTASLARLQAMRRVASPKSPGM